MSLLEVNWLGYSFKTECHIPTLTRVNSFVVVDLLSEATSRERAQVRVQAVNGLRQPSVSIKSSSFKAQECGRQLLDKRIRLYLHRIP